MSAPARPARRPLSQPAHDAGTAKLMSGTQDEKAKGEAPAGGLPTDAEIEAAADRLGADWLRGSSRPHAAGPGRIVQNLARGRAHSVTVEVRRLPQGPAKPR